MMTMTLGAQRYINHRGNSIPIHIKALNGVNTKPQGHNMKGEFKNVF